MPPSSRRAKMRAVRPQRRHSFLLFLTPHAWQTLPPGPNRGNGTPVRPHVEQPGRTTPR